MSAHDTSAPDVEAPDRPVADRRPPARTSDDLTAIMVYLLGALCVTAYLWVDPSGRTVAANRQDTLLFEWGLAHAARVVTHGVDPFATHLMNMPHGVNLLANTSALGLAIPLVPLTLLAGPQVSLIALLTLAPVATATSWYFVLHRHLACSRGAAFIAGLFCGFSPAMISQSTGHPNVTAQFLLPLIMLTVLRMRERGRALRTGLQLAALVVAQVFINEELLFLTVLALAVFILAMLFLRPDEVRPHVPNALRVCGVTAVVAGAVLAYPLARQFFGPMAYHGLPVWVRDYGTDLAAFPAYATESLSGSPDSAAHLAQGPVEENTFFGWSLLALVVVIVIWLHRNRVVVALAITGGTLALLSLGPNVHLRGKRTTVSGLWDLVVNRPVFDSVVPTRIALLLTPVIGLLLAISVDRLATPEADGAPAGRRFGGVGGHGGFAGGRSGVSAADRRKLRNLWICAIAVALVPLVPTPITTAPRPPTPVFFTSGAWRRYVPANAVIVPVAPGWGENLDAMQWQLATNLGFATSGGYFLAPPPDGTDRTGMFGPAGRPTSSLLTDAANRGTPADVTPDQRRQAAEDLRYWHATTLVMADTAHGADAVRATVSRLVGEGTHVSDVWLWDVRARR
jgi:hypothetical protein